MMSDFDLAILTFKRWYVHLGESYKITWKIQVGEALYPEITREML